MAKAVLVDGLVNDALALLAAFEDESEEAEATSALGLLALVAGQDVEQGEDGTWRIARKVAPDRVISVVDPEARHMHKSRSEYRDGYKAHLVIEPETGLVTATTLTPANAPDGPTGVTLLAKEKTQGSRSSVMVAMDRVRSSTPWARAKHQRAIKPWPTKPAVPGRFEREDFIVDYEGPHSHLSSRPHRHDHGPTDTLSSEFGAGNVRSGHDAHGPKKGGPSDSIPRR